MKYTILIYIYFVCLATFNYSYAAVTSKGEINVEGETKGIVPASSKVPLLVTLIIDRSLAEPGEDIKTIEITMPQGFQTQRDDFTGITRDGKKLPARVLISEGNVLRVELAEPIIDFQNSIYVIAFHTQTPNEIFEAVFKVLLRNREDAPVGEHIQEGQADGKLNNDDFTLQIIPNIPPAPVTGFTAEADKNGENDVTLRWIKSDDPDVNGYIIYRDKESIINVEKRASTTFRDVNVFPGTHTYQIAAYKTIFLQSDRSPILTVEVSEDTAPPEAPASLNLTISSEGIQVSWIPSVSRDVSIYRVMFSSTDTDTLKVLPNGEISTKQPANDSTEYLFVDNRQLPVGSYTYAVVAFDEANNASPIVKKRLRIFDKPYPNPFTPLSNDPDFNSVIFPARAIDDAEGEFSVMLYNIHGALVKTLTAQLGDTELKWDGKNENGDIVESGIYIFQLQVGENYITGTIIVAK